MSEYKSEENEFSSERDGNEKLLAGRKKEEEIVGDCTTSLCVGCDSSGGQLWPVARAGFGGVMEVWSRSLRVAGRRVRFRPAPAGGEGHGALNLQMSTALPLG